ncbi:hydrogenase maturation nickel metallochaperone HypA [Vibrio porteresiae]|uniref:Hydrogenase maturation factor HypA n=1 Tax=Vibrio porteresiae DSM 19223 TaxID=1123496 RepID=A0ABZ0QFA8_9VIBR|nr:hydrogenase maturation nickel metallochaperone HypA [Vibrio porteresiae]WPC74535.1 hydrogenase maturation nickel metallochaperone HypA [Vibrio porteresiae DSM 19223]
MHELSISLKTVDIVVEQARKHRVNKVTGLTLSIGALSCIEPDALRTGIEFASRETVAEGARLSIEMVPASGTCLDCGSHVGISSHMDACPKCNSYNIRVETGEELQIKNIEVE